jgi:hypothetical protein
VLSKDTIRGALVESLGAGDVEASRRLGRASVAAPLAVAHEVGRGVLDGPWPAIEVDTAVEITSADVAVAIVEPFRPD